MTTGRPTLAERIAALAADRVHGATWLAREAVRILGDAAAEEGPGWAAAVTDAASRLAGCKPAMAMVANAPARLRDALLTAGEEDGRAGSASLVEAALSEIEHGRAAAAETAAGLVPTGGVVVTCSRSSSVEAALVRAAKAYKAPMVLALESAGHGSRLAADLAARGVPAEVLPDSAARSVVGRSDLALVGADAVSSSGVVNGTPSLALAEACAGEIPLYAVAQGLAFTGRASAERGYDLVPLERLAGVACEEGVLDAQAVAALT